LFSISYIQVELENILQIVDSKTSTVGVYFLLHITCTNGPEISI
jgi:hypothetical protein